MCCLFDGFTEQMGKSEYPPKSGLALSQPGVIMICRVQAFLGDEVHNGVRIDNSCGS